MQSPFRLLVVDDSETDRELIIGILREIYVDAEIIGVSHPAIARDVCKTAQIDCVITDYSMPDTDGVTLAAELKEGSPYLAIVLMTSFGDEMLAAEALRSGISDYIPKSRITADSVRRMIDRSMQLCVQARLIDEQRGELENFAFALAHDFKQPIRQIMTFAQMISEGIGNGGSEEVEEHLAFLGGAALRLAKLVDVMSQYTLLNQPPKLGDVDLDEVLGGIRVALAPYLAERGAVVGTPLAAPFVHGNETLMTQALQNLIMNGLQYNSSRVPRVDVTVHKRSDDWVLQVRDNGVGIAAQHLTEIFKPLVRLHSASEYPGTGLGLTLAKRAVAQQGGSIWCVSEPGHGSVFHVQLQPAQNMTSRPKSARPVA